MKITPPTTNPPSGKRTKIILATLIVISIAGLAWLIHPSPEPAYNGKPFTLWLEEYNQLFHSGKLDEEHQQALNALRQMGAKAVPIIISTLEKSDSPMRNKYREVWPTLPAWIKKALPKPNTETFSVSDAGYPLLLVPATNAVPQLHRLARSHNPALREVAFQDMFFRFSSYTHSFPNEDLLPLCVSALNDPSAAVRMHAAGAVGNLGPAASNAVPALITTLQGSQAGRKKGEIVHCRAAAANALDRIGPAAASSIPALTNLLPSADTYLRVQIASAVWHITSDENIALPVLISDIPKLDRPYKVNAFFPLAEMGPRAKPALPMLLNELTNTNNTSYILGLVTNTLQAIDPEAAAKAGVK